MEKRHFTRIIFRSEAIVKSGNKTLKGEIENLSLNGMMVAGAVGIPAKEQVEVEISLAGTSSELTLKIEGVVVREAPAGSAIQFTGMGLDSFIHLKNIMAYNQGDEEKIMQEFYDFMRFNESPIDVDQGEYLL